MPHGDRRADVMRRVRGIRGTVAMEQALRIRFDYAAAVPWIRQVARARRHGSQRARPHRRRRTGRGDRPRPEARRPTGWCTARVFDVSRGRDRRHHPHLVSRRTASRPTPLDVETPHPTRPRSGGAAGRRASTPTGPYARAGAPLAARAARAHPRRHRRHRRGRDDEPARGVRRRAQLGLPLRLAARRLAHPAGAARARLHRRGPRLARLAAARDRRRSRRRADHVRAGRRTPARRVGARLAARLPRRLAGARRQRGVAAVPGRRLRRGDARAAADPRARDRRRPFLVVAAGGAARARRAGAGPATTTASGRSAVRCTASPTRAR